MMYRRLTPWILTILAVTLLAAWNAFPLKERIALGLDLQGGMHLVLKVDTNKLPKEARADAPERALEVIRNRIDQFGVKEPSINRQGEDEIVVQLPGVTERERALEIIGRTAHLEFKLVADDPEHFKQALAGDVPSGFELKDSEGGEKLLLHSEALLTGATLASAQVQFDQRRFNAPAVGLRFNTDGAKAFAKATSENVGRRLAIVLDGKVQSAPRIQEAIPGGEAVISGRFTPQEAADLALVLRVGALPAPVTIEEERTVGPLLGSDSVRTGLRAVVIGLGLVFLFMMAYYLLAGVIANIALMLNGLLILGGLGMLHSTLTLPGIAGIVLTLGMAVDANVLIYERMREEMKLNRPIRQVIANGYDRAFSAIFDSNFTTLISSFLLFQFGTGPIRGFAVTTTIGLIASMFTAIVVTRVIFEALYRSGWLTRVRMLQLIGQTRIDFLKPRKICYTVTLLLTIGGLILFFKQGERAYGVDFSGGQVQQYHFDRPVSMGKVREALREIDLGEASIQQFGNPNEILVRTSVDTVKGVQQKFQITFPDNRFQLTRVEHVGPSVGKDLRRRATLAIFWAILSISVYVAYRFREWSFGVAGVVALLHDVLIAVGALALTHRQMSLTLIAALLTIAGYSINDTIVTYDRIRELRRTVRKISFPDLINLAVNQTLGRTILTTGVTLLTVIALFLFGGPVLNDFAFALLVGFTSGAYSTVYIASPLLLAWERKKR
ncbi:MAG: protein translocase subunit SecD [Candidatus Omnitrophica bacterium]|nr:protein translocase subunit SecD [Candidatus Omnitrophota bacterium]